MACYEMKKLIYLTGKPAPVLKFIVTLSISAKTKKNCIKGLLAHSLSAPITYFTQECCMKSALTNRQLNRSLPPGDKQLYQMLINQ